MAVTASTITIRAEYELLLESWGQVIEAQTHKNESVPCSVSEHCH